MVSKTIDVGSSPTNRVLFLVIVVKRLTCWTVNPVCTGSMPVDHLEFFEKKRFIIINVNR